MSKIKHVTRRHFIKGSLAAGFSLAAWRNAYGANEAVRVGVVGFNGRGKNHIDGYLKCHDAKLVALCDCDSDVLHKGAAKLEKDKNLKVETYTDLRKLLENKDIDAISIATPNHQHSIQTIWAIQAGKDVYCEKPISHNVWEGRRVVEAAASSGRVVASGTQSRSNPGMIEAVKYLQDGKLGKIQLVRGLCYKRRASIGKVNGEQPIPKNIDYDLWCGPARKLPLNRKNLHYDWHWAWETGNGDLGNQGIHQMDIARWIVGESRLSPAVVSVGGRFGYEDDGQTPNTMLVYHDYKPAPIIFEVRGLPSKLEKEGGKGKPEMDEFKGAQVGVVTKCEGGWMVMTTYHTATATDNEGKVIEEFKGEGDHFKNFIGAVLARAQNQLKAPIIEGHLSSALCHTANISYRLGKAADQNVIREKLRANPAAVETFESINMHLQTNLVDLKKDKVILGEYLTMDTTKENFGTNEEANKLLRREYRAPFTIV